MDEKKRLRALDYRAFGDTGLRVSAVGFGAIACRPGEGERSLVDAMSRGINLIDTAANYAQGESERAVGDVLGRLAELALGARSSFVVVTKVGYLQGEDLDRASRLAAGSDDIMRLNDWAAHSLDVGVLTQQLQWSRQRLRDVPDVCLLHNPEHFFDPWIRTKNWPPPPSVVDAYFARIRDIFGLFATEVADGHMRYFGVSSNALGGEEFAFLPLSRYVEAATLAGAAHLFKVVQAPLNLIEQHAVRKLADGRSVFATAHGLGMAVLTNRPLNAVQTGHRHRLSFLDAPAGTPNLFAALARLRAIESRLATEVGSDCTFNWAEQFERVRKKIVGAGTWDVLLQSMIRPRFRAIVAQSGGAWREYEASYVDAFESAIDAMTATYRTDHNRDLLEGLSRAELQRPGLEPSQVALLACTSTPHVTATLTSMHRPHYVDAAIHVCGRPIIDDVVRKAGIFSDWWATRRPAGDRR